MKKPTTAKPRKLTPEELALVADMKARFDAEENERARLILYGVGEDKDGPKCGRGRPPRYSGKSPAEILEEIEARPYHLLSKDQKRMASRIGRKVPRRGYTLAYALQVVAAVRKANSEGHPLTAYPAAGKISAFEVVARAKHLSFSAVRMIWMRHMQEIRKADIYRI